MPTGYTANIIDGKITEFPKFALQCARAFGALIEMRDDPWDAKIPEEFKPHDYNLEKLEEVKTEMLRLQMLTSEQAERECLVDYQSRIDSQEKYKFQQKLENDRLEAMAAKVRDWEPPSANHFEMKNFMFDQINISKHDLSYFDKYDKIEKLSPTKWLSEKMEKVQKDIGHYAAEHEKEVERVKGRNLWVKQLRESLEAK